MTLRTRSKAYVFTGIAAMLYVVLGVVFADELFSFDNFWDSDAITGGSWISYALLAAIVIGGVIQAGRIPGDGIRISAGNDTGEGQVQDPGGWKLLLGNIHFAVLWMPIRFFVGQEWLAAGEGKLRDDTWMDGGTALLGFWQSAVAIPEAPARPKITYDWFRDLLKYMIDHEWYTWFAKVVAIGEFLIGLGLVAGAPVGIAAFFGTLLNFNFMMAGTVSSNPVLFGLTVFLVLGWKVAGWIGLDRFSFRSLEPSGNQGVLPVSNSTRPEWRQDHETCDLSQPA